MLRRLLRKIIGVEDPAKRAIPGLFRRQASLSPPITAVALAALAAKGRAEIDHEGEWQRFLVEVNVSVDDGTVLMLIVNGRRVATIEMSDSLGSFEIATSQRLGLQNGLYDVRQIETVEIATQEGKIVLSGAFTVR